MFSANIIDASFVTPRRAQQRVFSSREESATHSAWTETRVTELVRRAEEAGSRRGRRGRVQPLPVRQGGSPNG